MDEHQFIIDLAFKPFVSGLKLTPEQSQLILSHIGELLQEIEEEEKSHTNDIEGQKAL